MKIIHLYQSSVLTVLISLRPPHWPLVARSLSFGHVLSDYAPTISFAGFLHKYGRAD